MKTVRPGTRQLLEVRNEKRFKNYFSWCPRYHSPHILDCCCGRFSKGRYSWILYTALLLHHGAHHDPRSPAAPNLHRDLPYTSNRPSHPHHHQHAQDHPGISSCSPHLWYFTCHWYHFTQEVSSSSMDHLQQFPLHHHLPFCPCPCILPIWLYYSQPLYRQHSTSHGSLHILLDLHQPTRHSGKRNILEIISCRFIPSMCGLCKYWSI